MFTDVYKSVYENVNNCLRSSGRCG